MTASQTDMSLFHRLIDKQRKSPTNRPLLQFIDNLGHNSKLGQLLSHISISPKSPNLQWTIWKPHQPQTPATHHNFQGRTCTMIHQRGEDRQTHCCTTQQQGCRPIQCNWRAPEKCCSHHQSHTSMNHKLHLPLSQQCLRTWKSASSHYVLRNINPSASPINTGGSQLIL